MKPKLPWLPDSMSNGGFRAGLPDLNSDLSGNEHKVIPGVGEVEERQTPPTPGGGEAQLCGT